jgi:hypothetical protein
VAVSKTAVGCRHAFTPGSNGRNERKTYQRVRGIRRYMTNRQDERPDNKVERVVRKYDLGDLGQELERRWTGEGRERQSLRDLAHYFNRRVLESAMDEAGVVTLQGELENIYELLTEDDVTEGARTQARNRLEREEIDADDLQDDFVSHYAIHTYLRDYRDAEYESGDDRNQREKSVETIQRLTSRLNAVTRRNVENLRSTDRLEIGPVDVLADVQVVCQECGRQEDPIDLIERGSCRCREGE